MRWERGRRYGGIEDRRGMRTGGVAGGGVGIIAVALLGYFFFGINPLTILDAGSQLSPVSQESGRSGTPADQAGAFIDTILSSTTDLWMNDLPSYQPPMLVLYQQATGTGC